MRVLLITIGSAGDVHPFVGLSLALRARGHTVTLATNGHFEPLVRGVGLDFAELGSADHYKESIHDPRIWHARKGLAAVLERGVVPLLKPTIELIATHRTAALAAGERLVVVASTLALGARIAQDAWGVRTVMAHLAPVLFRSVISPPVLPGLPIPRWTPAWAWRTIFDLGDIAVVDPILAPPINALRQAVGLAPVKAILRDWMHSPALTLGLFPDWFARPPADWPPQVVLTGFPQFDEAGHSALPDLLAAFLDAGERPIVFTAGTAMTQGAAFFATSIAAAQRLGRRAVLLTRHPEQLPATLPDGIVHAQYAPFSALLPRAAVLVHHGGIGTTAQALAAGVPQLIRPMAHDQPDNAARVRRLGVGRSLSPRAYTLRRVARSIDALLRDGGVAARCTKVKMRFIGAQPVTRACEAIEAVGTS